MMREINLYWRSEIHRKCSDLPHGGCIGSLDLNAPGVGLDIEIGRDGPKVRRRAEGGTCLDQVSIGPMTRVGEQPRSFLLLMS